MSDIEEAVLEKTAAELQATTNNQVLPIVTNVAIEAELRKVRDEAVEHLGGVHLLFNNAGVGGGGNAWNATQKDWDWVFGVNLAERNLRSARIRSTDDRAANALSHRQHCLDCRYHRRQHERALPRDQAQCGCADGKPVRRSAGRKREHWLLGALSRFRQYQHL